MALRIAEVWNPRTVQAGLLLPTFWVSMGVLVLAVSHVTHSSPSLLRSRPASHSTGGILQIYPRVQGSTKPGQPLGCLRCFFPSGVHTPDASSALSISSSSRSPAHTCPPACVENGVRIPIVPSPAALSDQFQCFLAPSLSTASRSLSRCSLQAPRAGLSSFVHTGLPSRTSLSGASLSQRLPLFNVGGRPMLSVTPLSSSKLGSVSESDGRLVASDGLATPGTSAGSPDNPQFPSFPSNPATGFSPFSNGDSAAPLPAPADPIYPAPLTAETTMAGRRLEVDPSGPLGQMQALLREGIYKAGPYIQEWPQNEERDVDMLVTKLDETAAISPGQKTVIQLPFRERDRMVRHMRATRSATIFLGYVDYREEGDVEIARPQENRSALTGPPPNSQGTKDDYMLIGYGAIAEPTEIHMLDKSGELGLRIMGRVKIVSVLEASELSFRVRVVPHKDENKRDGFVNPLVSRENIKALYSLYDRVNKMELLYRKLEGKMHQAHLVSLRPSLEDKVDEFVNETSGATEQDIGEWVSFCAMDHHIDARARCWAMAQQDTELRLDVVRRSLEDKLRQLQAEVKRLKDQPGFRDPEDVKAPISEPVPLNIKL
ncbi:putative transmembrane protein [Toxoplasma gondii RUB]|uniref:Putative transmembrane protein n=1 Tax=Toxoplasma gondii RUB TaxID=935652 RepID=A0A086LSR3_TOXGO|nr:putative transmembrane protein [Toxoplasma gondii RUB]